MSLGIACFEWRFLTVPPTAWFPDDWHHRCFPLLFVLPPLTTLLRLLWSTCDVMIYNRIYIGSWSLTQSTWNLHQFPSDKNTRSIFCFWWQSLGELCNGGRVTRKTKSWLEAWNVQSYLPFSRECGEGLEMELVIPHAYMRKPPWKSQ